MMTPESPQIWVPGKGRVSADALTEEDWEAVNRQQRDLLISSIAHTRRLTKAQLERLDEWLQQPPMQKQTRRWG